MDLTQLAVHVGSVAAAVAALHVMANGFAKLSEVTPWEWDDPWGKKLVGMATSALEFVTGLTGAFQKK